jgi:subfamily B ATP-binding cassette protein MsbA
MLVAFVGVLEATYPVLIGLVFDTVLGSADIPLSVIPILNIELSVAPEYGIWLLVALVVVTIFKAFAVYGSVATTALLGHSVVRDLRTDLYRSIVAQPLSFFSGYPTGELISRVSSDVEKIQFALSETLADFLKQCAIFVAMISIILLIDPKLALYSLVLVPLVYYPSRSFGRRLRGLSQSNQSELAGMANILFETFSGNRIVKIFTMESAETGKFRAAAERVFKLGFRQRLIHAMSSPMMEVLGIFVIAGFLLYAQNEIQAGRMSMGSFVGFTVALFRLYDPIRRMSGINNSFQQAIGASNKLFEIMESPPEPDPGKLELTKFQSAIDFRNVRFGYTPQNQTIEGVSFRVLRGEVLAVVGSSGAGKTTLVNLLPRFYDVSSGSITIDDTDLREFQLKSLREKIAMVTQDVILFNDTVRTNIAYGNPHANDERILAAASAALVDDFVRDLPDGYETVIGERGVRLSGGERQRISIARALLKDAPILILDEATSSLDSESEALVGRALDNLMEGRTTIVIAHRLSTVRRADRILVLGDGRVQEEGTHDELVLRKGIYWKLHKLQFEDVTS